MKFKLTLLLLAVSYFVSAQKQIQPYTFTKTAKDKKTVRTILIYATAKTVNNIEFTLKNDKDEILKILTKDKKIEDNSFTVTPFTEIVFRNKLIDAILGIHNEKEESDKKNDADLSKILGIDEKDSKNIGTIGREDYVREIRNIYQFFNALVITAFQYDTEPVAGTLKYELNVRFKKEPNKKINDLIVSLSKKRISNFSKNYDTISVKSKKEFRYYLIKNKDIVEEYGFKEVVLFRRFFSYFYLDNFELENEKVLKKIYHKYELENLIKDSIFQEYIRNKRLIYTKEFKESKKNIEIEKIKEDINEKKEKKTALRKKDKEDLLKKIDSVNRSKREIYLERHDSLSFVLDSLNKRKDFLVTDNNATVPETLSLKIKKLDENLSSLESEFIVFQEESNKESRDVLKEKNDNDQEITDLESEITSLNTRLIALENLLSTLIEEKDSLVKISNNLIPEIISKNIQFYFWDYKINDIQIDFNEGFIEHMSVIGNVEKPYLDFKNLINSLVTINEKYKKIKESNNLDLKDLNRIIKEFYEEPLLKETLKSFLGKELKFVNQFPIGFSSKSDFSDLYGYDLVHVEKGKIIFQLPVSEVLKIYNQKHQNDRLDFSPKSQVVNLPGDDLSKKGEIELKKQKSSKILSARIYSDFLGFKESNPNGLLQAEIEKKIPLWTKRFPSPFFGQNANKGFFNYINLNLTFSRIEDREQDLQVRYADEYINNVYSPKKFVTYLDLIKRENTSIGLDVNLLSFDFTAPKLRLEINSGIHFARVRAIDSLRNSKDANLPLTKFLNKSVNTVRYYPADFILRVRPEERFGGFIRIRPFKIITPKEEEFYSVSSKDNFLTNKVISKAWLHRYEMSLFYKPNPKGDDKFFFRYRNTNVSTWGTNGFSEFQVGYLAYLKF